MRALLHRIHLMRFCRGVGDVSFWQPCLCKVLGTRLDAG